MPYGEAPWVFTGRCVYFISRGAWGVNAGSERETAGNILHILFDRLAGRTTAAAFLFSQPRDLEPRPSPPHKTTLHRALYQLQLVPLSEAKKHIPPEFHIVSLFGYEKEKKKKKVFISRFLSLPPPPPPPPPPPSSSSSSSSSPPLSPPLSLPPFLNLSLSLPRSLCSSLTQQTLPAQLHPRRLLPRPLRRLHLRRLRRAGRACRHRVGPARLRGLGGQGVRQQRRGEGAREEGVRAALGRGVVLLLRRPRRSGAGGRGGGGDLPGVPFLEGGV